MCKVRHIPIDRGWLVCRGGRIAGPKDPLTVSFQIEYGGAHSGKRGGFNSLPGISMN